jgi:DNA-binding Lrp family transcriptional regulator
MTLTQSMRPGGSPRPPDPDHDRDPDRDLVPRGNRATLDAADRAILAELVQDARLSIRALADRVHLSRSAIQARLQALRESGVLQGFTARVDRGALGLRVSALIMVSVEETHWQDLATAFSEIPYVETVKAVTGGADFIITVRVPDTEWLSRVVMRRIQAIPGVRATRSHIVLDSVPGTAPWGESGRSSGQVTQIRPVGRDFAA